MFGKFNFANTVLVGMSQAVGVRAERCNRMCHKNNKCNLCETNCPTQAIKVGGVGERINVDWDKCVYCGICVNICPTGVYSIRETPYKEFLNTYLNKISPEGVLRLSCKENKGSDAALTECLGILGLPDLLYFYINGAKTIQIEFPCNPECPSKGYGKEILEDEIAELQKLAEYFEHLNGLTVTKTDDVTEIVFPKQFEIKTSDPKKEKAERQSVETTRRGMFSFMKDNATDTFLRSAALLTPQEIPARTPIRDKKEVPEKRKIFIETLLSCGKILKSDIPVGAYFYNIQLSDECNFCKVCTRMCPTGAFNVNEADDAIVFTAAHCTSCGMCNISCYHRYIKAEKTLTLKEFFDEAVKAVKKQ